MSYILDALKKSDQARQRDLAPEPPTITAPIKKKSGGRPLWQYLVVFALCLNAFLLVWWLHPWQSGGEPRRTVKPAPSAGPAPEAKKTPPAAAAKKAEAPSPPMPEPVQTAKVEPVPAPTQSPAPPSDTPTRTAGPKPGFAQAEPVAAGPPSNMESDAKMPALENPRTAPPMRGPVTAPPKTPQPKTAGVAGAAAKPTPAPARKPPEFVRAGKPRLPYQPAETDAADLPDSSPAKGGPPIDTQELITDLKSLTGPGAASGKAAAAGQPARYHELPSAVRASLPNMAISMLIYSSKPADRHINVNGSRMREGQEVTQGLKVEEITPEGAVFNFKGQRFFKGIMGD